MKAAIVRALSDDLSTLAVEEVAPPDGPGPGEVRIRVRAAGVNFPDLLMVQGKYQFKPPLPFAPGLEGAGEAIAAGAGAPFRAGDRVVFGARAGSWAEEVVVPAVMVRPLPETLSFEQGAAYPAAYLTAYVALVRRAQAEAGETLLVHGAAGGVGLAAVDLGKHLGLTVIATASTAEKRAFLKSYGADAALAPANFKDEVKRLTNGRGADIVFDPVGGGVFDESVRCIAFDGRLLVIGFAGGRIPSIDANMPLIKGFSVVGVRAGEYGRQFPERGRENIAAIDALAREGRVRPHVHAVLPLAEARAALELLRARRVIGKLVLAP